MIPRHEHSLLAYIYVIWEVRDRLFLALIEYVMPNMICYDLQLLNCRKFPINAKRNKNEQKKFNGILFSDGKILELSNKWRKDTYQQELELHMTL